MNQKRLKIAFLGGALHSAVGYAHYSAINIDHDFELVAGCFSRNQEFNLKTAQVYGIPNHFVYEDLSELIEKASETIDVIAILTPNDQHANQVLQCIEAGIPVICEKSLAGSVEDTVQIKAALERKKGFLVVISNYLGYPMIRELKNLIENGSLGKINHIQVEMPQEGFIRIDKEGNPVVPQSWRLKDHTVPTISLDLGIHLHMFIKYLTNESPLNVMAKSESLGNFSSIIDNINCVIEYTDDITCNMWYSKIAIGHRNGLKIRIYGTKASAEWVQEKPEILNLADIRGRCWKIDRGNDDLKISNQKRYTRFKVGHPAGFIEAFANYYQDIAIALRYFKENKSLRYEECFGIEEAYEGLQLLEAIQKSSQSRSWENIENL